MIDRGRIDEPSSCHLCGNTMSMELVHNRCLFTDKQMIRLQVGVGVSGVGGGVEILVDYLPDAPPNG